MPNSQLEPQFAYKAMPRRLGGGALFTVENGLTMRKRKRVTAPKPIKSKIIRCVIELGKAGLFYGTSPDLRGLLVAEKSRAGTIAAIPETIARMYLASGAVSVEIIHTAPMTWSVRPLVRR